MKLTKGDVFCISTKLGFGFLQFIESTQFGDYVRILDYLSSEKVISQAEINKLERWCIDFTLKAAVRKKIIEKVGNFELPANFTISIYARSKHNIRGESIGWFLVNRKTLQSELKKELTDNEIKLSPHGFMNDTLIIEKIESNWNLSDWK